MTMTTKPIGLYVHIPFCVRKCNYCDFCSFPGKEYDFKDEYVSALCREIEGYQGKGIALDSIFFGGGTPTTLDEGQLGKIVAAIKDTFSVTEDVEFSMEANPGTVDEQKLKALTSMGVNRLSFGLQSIHDNELKILGRIHNYDDFAEAFAMARRCGISNINVDLMYGIPEQTADSFALTLEKIKALSPEHISLYGLILEEGTPLYRMQDSLPLPSEDEECDMYYFAADALGFAGYNHYEISNYARDGKECRHNLKYWRCEEYIGVGLSAYSYYDGVRFGNTDDVAVYLSGNYTEYSNRETIDDESAAYERVMLGLRTAEGISLSEYETRFLHSFISGREEKIASLINEGYARISGDRFSLTEKGFYVSNSILTELI